MAHVTIDAPSARSGRDCGTFDEKSQGESGSRERGQVGTGLEIGKKGQPGGLGKTPNQAERMTRSVGGLV
jgi:hypothetical protein